ncbi:MAG: hypothetical protein JO166_05800 [Deltaproteobacteria bacterium]|nr:hypothetical protein [Deltaproteobacteria bacterium]
MSAIDIIAALAALDSAELSSVITAGVSILASRSNGKSQSHEPGVDELLSISQAAPLLQKSKSWLYHNHRDLPFTVRGLGATPRFSRRGLEKYVSERSGVNR